MHRLSSITRQYGSIHKIHYANLHNTHRLRLSGTAPHHTHTHRQRPRQLAAFGPYEAGRTSAPRPLPPHANESLKAPRQATFHLLDISILLSSPHTAPPLRREGHHHHPRPCCRLPTTAAGSHVGQAPTHGAQHGYHRHHGLWHPHRGSPGSNTIGHAWHGAHPWPACASSSASTVKTH